MANNVVTTIQHDDSKSLEVRFKKKAIIKEFSLVGRLNTLHANNFDARGMDIIDLMASLPASANVLLQEIKSQLDYKTNEAKLGVPHNTSAQRSRTRAAKKLRVEGAIKKAGRRSFMINPFLIVPPIDNQEDVIAKWNALP